MYGCSGACHVLWGEIIGRAWLWIACSKVVVDDDTHTEKRLKDAITCGGSMICCNKKKFLRMKDEQEEVDRGHVMP